MLCRLGYLGRNINLGKAANRQIVWSMILIMIFRMPSFSPLCIVVIHNVPFLDQYVSIDFYWDFFEIYIDFAWTFFYFAEYFADQCVGYTSFRIEVCTYYLKLVPKVSKHITIFIFVVILFVITYKVFDISTWKLFASNGKNETNLNMQGTLGTIRILSTKCSHKKAKNKILFGPILLAVNHRFNIKLHEEREKKY